MGTIAGFALPGVVLLLWGISALWNSAMSSTIPVAKIEDGRPVPPAVGDGSSRQSRRGIGRIAFGIILAAVGGYVGYIADALSGPFQLGRPFRVHGRPRQCRRARGTGWHDDARPALDQLGAWTRGRLGERWLAAARAEHASVPAFRTLASRLARAGAPVALVNRCEAAADDELRHARRCFALARGYSGVDWTAGALVHRADGSSDLSALAVESLLDGCIGEGIAADLARAGALGATDPVIRESLTMIANDEATHAELAWAIVAFCIERGGAAVRQSLGARARVDRVAVSPGPTGLGRSVCKQIARARLSRVRDRLATAVLRQDDRPIA
jgi:hypothetical protein